MPGVLRSAFRTTVCRIQLWSEGQVMKKVILPVLAIGSAWVIAGTVAHAEQGSDVLARLNALEKENAAIRKENAALRENKTLRQQNATLKSSAPPQAAQAASEAGAKRADPFGAYAADLPLAYKARLPKPADNSASGAKAARFFRAAIQSHRITPSPISPRYRPSWAAAGLDRSICFPKSAGKRRLALTIALQVHPGMSAVSSVTAKARTPASYRPQARSIQPF